MTSTLPVSASSVFIQFSLLNGVPFGVGGVPASTPLMRQMILSVNDSSTNTAVALANPGVGTATITFQLLDKLGNQVAGLATRTMLANNHTAFFVRELFPNVPGALTGTMRITSDKPIVTTALVFEGATFGALPVFPLP